MEAHKITNNIYNTAKKLTLSVHSTRSTKRYQLHHKRKASMLSK